MCFTEESVAIAVGWKQARRDGEMRRGRERIRGLKSLTITHYKTTILVAQQQSTIKHAIFFTWCLFLFVSLRSCISSSMSLIRYKSIRGES